MNGAQSHRHPGEGGKLRSMFGEQHQGVLPVSSFEEWH